MLSGLKEHTELHIYTFDFAPCAVKLLQEHKDFNASIITPFVCDLAKDELPQVVPVGKITCAVMIFVLSAISPEHFPAIADKIYNVCSRSFVLIVRPWLLVAGFSFVIMRLEIWPRRDLRKKEVKSWLITFLSERTALGHIISAQVD